MTTPWRVAKSLDKLRTQINNISPNRNTKSDGTKGDDAHAKRKSDHNPKNGVVHALDITHDPLHGVNSQTLAEALVKSEDPRIDYIISNGRIIYGAHGKHPWDWQSYGGVNPHNKHVHISVVDDPKLADDAHAWKLSDFGSATGDTPPTLNDDHPVLVKGSKGAYVQRLQKMLNAHGAKPELNIDGDFGERTQTAVEAFQKAQKIVVDGVVGDHTWDLLEITGT